MAATDITTREARLPDISVCIATFRRPQGLARLLESLQAVCEGDDECIVEIIVVDNDVGETARALAGSMRKRFKSLRYFVEARQNIAHARNCCVREACGTWIAFIDDDEVAGSNWLKAYWEMASQKVGDGYFGPVIPRLEHTVPAWMDKEVFFGRPRFPTGTRLSDDRQMRTGNAFIRRSFFSSFKFDPRYGRTGGEDSDLFGRLSDNGAVFYWCDEAETFEYYPIERLSLRWLVQRSFRGGYTYTLIKRNRQPGFWRQIPGLVKAVGGVVAFGLMLPFELLRGRKYTAKRLMRISVQFAHIWAFLNLPYEEYKVARRGIFPAGPVGNQMLAAGGRCEDDI